MADALSLLREDHEKVKQLFEEFEQAEEPKEQQRIVDTALMELDVHAKIEEELFYPAMKKAAEAQEIVLEAEEEHHIVHILTDELRELTPKDEQYRAKFMVLAESVKHHIEEEESEMLPKAEELSMDLEQLGEQMSERKQELMAELSNGHSNGGGPSRRKSSTASKRGSSSRSSSRTQGRSKRKRS